MPLYFYCFRCVARFWNSLLTTKNALLIKINEADLLLAHRKGRWTLKVLSALREMHGADVHISFSMNFEQMLHEQTIR